MLADCLRLARAAKANAVNQMVSGGVYDGSGDDWQEYCEQLFALRHPNNYARIPDQHRGDLGLEGYSTDGSGCGYQCYAPEAIDIGERAKSQMRKIRRDTNKLKDNAPKLHTHLGDVVLKRWILVVPRYDSKDVTAHCRQVEQDVRGYGLPFIDPEFRIQVQTPEVNFVVERATLEAAGLGFVTPTIVEVTAATVEALCQTQPEYLENLQRKIACVVSVDANRRKLRDTLLRASVASATIQDRLRVTYPVIYEQYLRVCDIEKRAVEFRCQLEAQVQLDSVHSRLSERLLDEVKSLSTADVDHLSYGAIADWLRLCAIEFAHREGV